MTRDGLENIITTGMINGKKSRGTQRVKHLDGLQMCMVAKENTGLIHGVTDRKKCRETIANATRQDT